MEKKVPDNREIYAEEFRRGVIRASKFFNLIKSRPKELEEHYRRVNWSICKNPLIWVFGEQGVDEKRVHDSIKGMTRLVIAKYGLNLGFDIFSDSDYATGILGDCYGTKDITGPSGNAPFDNLVDRIREDYFNRGTIDGEINVPHATVIIANRSLKEPYAWGRTSGRFPLFVLSRDPSSVEMIAAHELIHLMDLDGQNYTKGDSNDPIQKGNCSNECLMSYGLRSDNLCLPCEAGLLGMLHGMDEVAKDHGFRLVQEDKKMDYVIRNGLEDVLRKKQAIVGRSKNSRDFTEYYKQKK